VFFSNVLNISAHFLPQDTRDQFEDSWRPFYISQRIPGTVQMCVTNVEHPVHSACTSSGKENFRSLKIWTFCSLQIRTVLNSNNSKVPPIPLINTAHLSIYLKVAFILMNFWYLIRTPQASVPIWPYGLHPYTTSCCTYLTVRPTSRT
jgi:hypothetical protein